MQNYSGCGCHATDLPEVKLASPCYCVLTIGRPAVGTRTGIGLLIYRTDGRLQVAHFDDLERAFARKDAVDYSQVSTDGLDVTSLRRFIAGVPRLMATPAAARRFRDCPLQIPYRGCAHLLIEATDLQPLPNGHTAISERWPEIIREADTDNTEGRQEPSDGLLSRLWRKCVPSLLRGRGGPSGFVPNNNAN